MLMTQVNHAYNRLFAIRSLMKVLAISLLVGIFGAILPRNALAQSPTIEFDIPQQRVSSALRAYAQQAKVQLLVLTEGLEGIQANPVVGSYSPNEALRMLLGGTGLLANFQPDATVMIRREPGAHTEGLAHLRNRQGMYFAPQASSAPEKQASVADDRTNERSPRSVSDTKDKSDEIIVTGSQIRGTGAVGTNVITMDREAIEITGVATTQEILHTLPQNFGGSQEVATVGLLAGNGNFGYASTVNLRGLGTESTLLLLDGRRSAPGGGEGSFVDLNSISVDAIERIEVLPDGASAIYGSDAIGGVINVILRDDYEGAETRIRYAPDVGSDMDELQVSQLWGTSWDSGNLLAAYQYHDRSSLDSADRAATANSDLTRLGGTNRNTTSSNPGNIVGYTFADGSSQNVQLAVPTNQDGTNLAATDLLPNVTNLQNIREGTTVLPKQTRHSIFVSASQKLTDSVDIFAEGRYSSREAENRFQLRSFTQLTVPSTNPFFVDPFGNASALRLRYSYIDDYGAPRQAGKVTTSSGTLGARYSTEKTWRLEAYASHGSEGTDARQDRFANSALLAEALADPDPATAFNPFADGTNTNPATLAAIEALIQVDHKSTLDAFNAKADGDIFQMPGGPAKLAVGAALRGESIERDQSVFLNSLTPSTSDFDLDRNVSAAFAELYLPVVTEKNDRAGLRELVISIAGRYDEYSDFGSTFNPKLGLTWSPIRTISLRSTVGTSFRAPLLTELNDQDGSIALFTSPDPASITGSTNTLFLFGNSPDLVPQKGTTWTAGFGVLPELLSGVTVDVTYFATEVDDRIQLPGNNIFEPLQNESVFAPIIQRNPTEETVTALLNDPDFGGTPLPPDQIGAIVDFRTQNIAKAELSGVDLTINYGFETEAGSFDASLYASHLFSFKEQLANGPLVNNVDTLTKPNSLNLRATLSWDAGSLYGVVIGHHVGGYEDRLSFPERPVSSWTTWDMQVGYDFSEVNARWLAGCDLSLRVQNVFDRDPPFIDGSNGIGFDAVNASILGRITVLQLSKNW